MRIALVIAGVLAALSVPGTAAAAPPGNDNLASATVVSTLPYTDSVNNTEATIEPGEPLQCIVPSPEKSVWYSFTPASDMVLRADTGGSNFSSFLEVFQSNGPGFGGLQGIQCQFFGNALTFTAVAGTTYYFQAAAFPLNSGGDLQFHLQEIPAPPNDDFAEATIVPSIPYVNTVDTTAAATQAGEPLPSCSFGSLPTGSVWYRYTPTASGSVSARAIGGFSTVLAAYTGSGLGGLSQVGCRNFQGLLTIHVDAGSTYYFQAGGMFGGRGNLQFSIDAAPNPNASFSRSIGDASVYDTVQFFNGSFDPGEVGIESSAWDFGDGTGSTEMNPQHRYGADGTYTVKLTVRTPDGRTGSTTQTFEVKTHDVGIAKLVVPQNAGVGQSKSIVVGLSNHRYAETVKIDLYRSAPSGWVYFASSIQSVPVRSGNKTSDFAFNYTFTSEDAALGKVTFRAVATIQNARDALSADNEIISLPTKVK